MVPISLDLGELFLVTDWLIIKSSEFYNEPEVELPPTRLSIRGDMNDSRDFSAETKGEVLIATAGHGPTLPAEDTGNEDADVLAKTATQEGIPTFIPAPRNHIKSLLQKESIIRWQIEWDNGETGRSVHNVLPKVKITPTPTQRPEIMFFTGHGPFPTYLKRFNIINSDSCGCGNLDNPVHYATSCLFTTSYHLTKPPADLEPLWWKRVMNNNNSRAKIRKLIHFIPENETLFSPKDGDNN
ncbi:hypothetical protein AVEN_34281-1 [Araneus ventricosus]|uniref:Uncharacterized protein n=1 Tax=Araneus ventricosus TaxID=182803 RepID=A0A4Y2TF58_ARAVE|nr:hypothetical protein AVEN_34281-1 [Araneus ventricosus]